MRSFLVSAVALGVTLVACERDRVPHPGVVSRLEQQIAASLSDRVHRPVSVWCAAQIACIARSTTTERIPIEVHYDGGGWTWRVHGQLIDSLPLEAYLKDAVAELGKPQNVTCAPNLRVLGTDEQIECWLANGGKAFVGVRADGQTVVEIELDKNAADARSELVLPQNDDTLKRLSTSLEHAEDGDGEEETPP